MTKKYIFHNISNNSNIIIAIIKTLKIIKDGVFYDKGNSKIRLCYSYSGNVVHDSKC